MRDAFGQFGKLRLGLLDTSLTTFSNLALNPGTLVNSGVSFFGGALSVGAAKAAVNIGPSVTIPGLSLPYSLWVDGWSNFVGVTDFIGSTNFYGLNSKFGTTIKNALSLKNGVDVKNALNVGNAPTTFHGILNVSGRIECVWLESELAKAKASPPKGFDMHHPTKKGWRLTHICLEGPEAAVYYRGVLDGKNYIDLPEYWKGLVDAESITVHLTPIGVYQELYYEITDWGTKIKVLNNSSSAIKCSYIVYGERKDVDKIVVEYEGKIEDYPGRDQRSIVGYHYDYRPGVNA